MAEPELVTGDLKFYYDTTIPGPADVKITGSALHRDPGLETSVLILIGSDARAEGNDKLPQGRLLRGGYWASVLLGYNFGSKAWLLSREVVNPETLALCERYHEQALQPLVDEGVVDRVEAISSRAGAYQINTLVRLYRPDAPALTYKYFINWQHQTAGGIA